MCFPSFQQLIGDLWWTKWMPTNVIRMRREVWLYVRYMHVQLHAISFSTNLNWIGNRTISTHGKWIFTCRPCPGTFCHLVACLVVAPHFTAKNRKLISIHFQRGVGPQSLFGSLSLFLSPLLSHSMIRLPLQLHKENYLSIVMCSRRCGWLRMEEPTTKNERKRLKEILYLVVYDIGKNREYHNIHRHKYHSLWF